MAPTTSSLSRQSPSLQATEKATRNQTKQARMFVSSVGNTAESTKRQSSTLNFGAEQKSCTSHPSPLNGFIKDAAISAAAPQHFYTHSLPHHSNVCWSPEHPYQTTTLPKTHSSFPPPKTPSPDDAIHQPLPKIPPPDYSASSLLPRIPPPDYSTSPLLPRIPPPDYSTSPLLPRITSPDYLSFATLPPTRTTQVPNNLLRSHSERTTTNHLQAQHVPVKPHVTITVPPNDSSITSFAAPPTTTPQLSSNHLPAEKEQAVSQHHHQQTIEGNILKNIPLQHQNARIKAWLHDSMTSLAAQSLNDVTTPSTLDPTKPSSTPEKTSFTYTSQPYSDADIDILKRVLDNPQRDHIKAWLQDLSYENRRHEKIDPAKLIAVRERIQSIHDNKKHPDSLLWDVNASCQYRQEARHFYEAAGVSLSEQRHAELHCMKSGEFYALSQLPIFPTRLMNLALTLQAFQSEHAAKSWMTARTGLHANIGGLLSPMWDALSTLSKDGRLIPADEYWYVPSRRHVVSKLKQCLEQSEHALKICQEKACAVPIEVIKILEQARTLYKMVNAKGFCYSAPSTISSACEFIKTTVDIVVSAATAGFTEPVVRSATNACTALIYAIVCPLEEVAAMDQMRMQNAKYANIFQEDGTTVDIKKVMDLWRGKRQTEVVCIEKAVERHFEKYSYKIEHAKERLKFLNEALAMPNEQALEQLHRLTACDAAITFVQTQIAALKPQVNKSAAQDADWLLQLSRANIDESLLQSISQAPRTHRSLFSNPITPVHSPEKISADRLASEQRKYTPSFTNAENQYSASIREVAHRFSHEGSEEASVVNESPDVSHDATEIITKSNSLVSFIQHLSNGKYLLKALERDLSQLVEEKKELQKLQEDANSISKNSPSIPLNHQHLGKKIKEKISRDIHHQEKKKALYLDKLKRLISDYQVFKGLRKSTEQHNKQSAFYIESSLNLLDSTGLIATMLCSDAKLSIEAIKSEYAHPGAISSRVIERTPLSIALSTVIGLGVTPEYRFGENTTALDWLHHSPPEILNVPQPRLAAEYAGASLISASIQELSRLQAHRLAHIENYLRNLDLCNTTIPNTHIALSNVAPSIKLTENHYLPNFADSSAYTQAHRLARNHPESNTLRKEKIKNFLLANIRTGTFGIRDLALRIFIDLKGLYLNKEAKQLLSQIDAHNQNANSQQPFVADRDDPLLLDKLIAAMTNTILDNHQEPSTSRLEANSIDNSTSTDSSPTEFESDLSSEVDSINLLRPPLSTTEVMRTASDIYQEKPLIFTIQNSRMSHTHMTLSDYPSDGSQLESEA